VTAPRPRVALVAAAGESRTALAVYLQRAGFDVHECDELALPSSFEALVMIADHATTETLVADAGKWLKRAKHGQRVVVVTSKPATLKSLSALHGERLHVLPAPVFAWDLVDALRASPPQPGPRGA
jgi:hypothetical protein